MHMAILILLSKTTIGKMMKFWMTKIKESTIPLMKGYVPSLLLFYMEVKVSALRPKTKGASDQLLPVACGHVGSC